MSAAAAEGEEGGLVCAHCGSPLQPVGGLLTPSRLSELLVRSDVYGRGSSPLPPQVACCR